METPVERVHGQIQSASRSREDGVPEVHEWLGPQSQDRVREESVMIHNSGVVQEILDHAANRFSLCSLACSMSAWRSPGPTFTDALCLMDGLLTGRTKTLPSSKVHSMESATSSLRRFRTSRGMVT